jgi:hypothetical protein
VEGFSYIVELVQTTSEERAPWPMGCLCIVERFFLLVVRIPHASKCLDSVSSFLI